MTKLKHYASRVMIVALSAAMFALSSCKDDETPDFSEPTILVTPGTAQQVPGGKVTFTLAVAAEGDLKSVQLEGADIKTYTAESSTKSDAFTYEYTVGANQALGDLTLNFKVIDQQGTAKEGVTTAKVTVTEKPKETVTVAEAITANTTWTANKFYLLKGNVYVNSGAELTIEPGTIILGDKVTKGSLIIARGAKIHAKGTETSPIIFTSSAPKGFRNYGDWGGVVILGKAQNNQSVTQKIEGISAATGDSGFHGTGTTIDDTQFNASSSGEFYYARIEFAGIALSTDNELNGLTLGSVGSGTEVHHVQVSYSGDDSFEWFGGTVNTKNLVAYRGWDDEFDTDFGYSGKNQFLVSYRDPNIADKSGSNGFESDNDGTGSVDKFPLTSATFSNVSFFGPFVYANLSSGALSNSNVNNNYQHGAHIRRNTAIQVYNTLFVGTGKIDGVLFEKANVAAVFKNNYIGRITGAAKGTTVAGNGYDDANFATDNIIAATLNGVDLSANFTGLTGAGDIANPFVALASTSVLATGATDVSGIAPLVKTDYRGAFSTTETTVASSWLKGWTNFDPNNADYGN